MGLCNIAVEFKKSRKLSIMRISVQDERFALCSVIGVSLEEILPDMKHICCQSWCVISMSVDTQSVLSDFLPWVLLLFCCGFFVVCAVGWQVGSKLSSTNKWIVCKIANFCCSSCPVHELGL